MISIVRQCVLALCLCVCATMTVAVEPDETLSDPVLEMRARDISRGLRCLVCRNESIDESHAELARDLRLLVRDRLKAGDSNAEVVAFVVDRYGEYVLLNPTIKGANWLLWAAGPIMFLIAVGIGAVYIRGRAKPMQAEPLSVQEQARLDEILKR